MYESTPDLIGVGSPLVDMLIEIEDSFLEAAVPGAKGGMELVDHEALAHILEKSGKEPLRAPGGAASNTTVSAARMGISTAFIGSVGEDEAANFYSSSLENFTCEPRLHIHGEHKTGQVLCLVTPDAERTMRTSLGAAADIDPNFFVPERFAGSKVVMLEGYTLFNHELTRRIAKTAKEAGCKLALDMASFEVVEVNRPVLEEILDNYVDLVFANEDEARAWNADGLEAALNDLAGRCEIAVVKEGKDGARIANGEERIQVEPIEAEAIDTTGAGDNWAAGFLSGYIRNLPLKECGRLGSMAGAACVAVTGAQLPQEAVDEMRGVIDAWS